MIKHKNILLEDREDLYFVSILTMHLLPKVKFLPVQQYLLSVMLSITLWTSLISSITIITVYNLLQGFIHN